MRKKRVLILVVCLALCAVFLQALPHGVVATTNPTGTGMAEFAIKAWREEWGYIYGTYGQVATTALVDSKANHYADIFSEIMSDGRTAYDHSLEWVGGRVADCSGLIKAYLMWKDDSVGPVYNQVFDRSANTMFNSATQSGPIETLPDTIGLLVWRDGHIGVYIGNGYVIEARGCEYGVVKTRLAERGWTHWCKSSMVSYSADGWTAFDGDQYYYRNGTYLAGLQLIDGKSYYFGQDGRQQTGFVQLGDDLRYFAADGQALVGWQDISGETYYLDPSNSVRRGWQDIAGKTYLFSDWGVLQTGWQQTEQGIFYLAEDGSTAVGRVEIDSIFHLFGNAGQLLTGWQDIEGQAAWLDQSGQMQTGLELIEGERFAFSGEGYRLTGWQELNNNAYYLNTETGAALSGASVIEDELRLFNLDGSLNLTDGLFISSGQVYWSDEQGIALAGLRSATAYNGSGEEISCDLVFSEAFDLEMDTWPAVALNVSTTNLIAGESESSAIQLEMTGTELAAEDLPEWLSLDTSVASVSESGLVRAVGAGRTVILARHATGAYAACLVTVLPDPETLLTDGSLALEPGRSALWPDCNLPAALLDTCTVTSSNEAVAVVENGLVSARGVGQATMSVEYGGRTVNLVHVTVHEPLLGVSASRNHISIPVGGLSEPVTAVVSGESGALLAYTSSDQSIAQVDSSGRIKGLSTGSCIITAQSGDKSVTIQVTVQGTYPTLRRGSSGELVFRLQQRLLDQGYMTGSPDGLFGSLTEFAVCAYQYRIGTAISGVADHNLIKALLSDLNYAAADRQYSSKLAAGDFGESVYALEVRLYEANLLKQPPDGQFDAWTEDALKALQNLNSLPESQTAGETEIAVLYSRQIQAGQPCLVLDDSGYEVARLQSRLKDLGYYDGPLDGQFDDAVEQAVCAFQYLVGLTTDGEAGPLTQGALFSDSAPAATDEAISAVIMVTLRLGTSSSQVDKLERRLIELGYHLAVADQSYDSLTAASVKAFQARAGLAQTGVADIATQKHLYAGTAPKSSVIYRYGNRGPAIARLQNRLNTLGYSCGTADGIFGSRTLYAVKSFQRRNGLVADGYIGPKTIARLFYTAPVNPTPTTTPTPSPTPTPAPTTTPTPTPTLAPADETPSSILQLGASGAQVEALERRLITLGYHLAVADQSYDSLTVASVKSFQSRAGLRVTGIADAATQSRLASSGAPKSSAVCRYGNRGTDVARIQRRLSALGYSVGTVDGIFGSRTLYMVKSFQRQSGLTADGIVGPNTISRLFGTSSASDPSPPADSTPPSPADTGSDDLKLGMTDDRVLALERRLIALGYHLATADRTYDSLTISSVKAFQKRAGLSQTGVADSLTQSRLAAGNAPRSGSVYHYGDRGSSVVLIQRQLNALGYSCGTADGIFGSRTSYAVKAFQRRSGLVADGYAGPNTIARLFG